MASSQRALARVDGVGRQAAPGVLSTLLALTSDAVLSFDGSARILGSNGQAEALTELSADELAGTDVRDLLFDPASPPEDLDAPTRDAAPSEDGMSLVSRGMLPLPTDGSLVPMSLRIASGGAMAVRVRCDRCAAPGETYLLVMHPADAQLTAERDHDRLVDELSLANRRLSGTLKIVLDTIDVQDVAILFDEVLEQISDTMTASGTSLYLAEADGFRLRGITRSLKDRRVPQFMAYGEGLETLVTRAGSALRLSLLPPSERDLRAGALTSRELMEEESGTVRRIPARQVPPFASLICVPVWFGGHVIAIIEVGWNDARPTRRDDARLLDSVAQYLSIELAAAITTMRAEREQHLDAVASSLRDRLDDMAGLGVGVDDGILSACGVAAREALGACVAPVELGAFQGSCIVRFPKVERTDEGASALDGEGILVPDADVSASHGVDDEADVSGDGADSEPAGSPGVFGDAGSVVPDAVEVPLSFDDLVGADSQTGVTVTPFGPGSVVAAALAERGIQAIGAVVDLGEVLGRRRVALLLRGPDAEPLEEVELAFLRRVAEDARDAVLAGDRRTKDARISQALQSGMRNELQSVEGLTAHGLYSSATATAAVGGDFYDLIRLPNRRACVILGDVSGHGVEAASVSAAVRTALGAYAWEGLPPSRMVRLLNDFLLGFSRLETFATLFVGMLDLATGDLAYCSAGHPPAIVLRASGSEMENLDVQSGVVGAFKGMAYRDGHARLAVGDRLLLYTDGVTEARDASGAFFGEQGLRDAVMAEAPGDFDRMLDRLLARLDAFTERKLTDDVAMVSLRLDALGAAPVVPRAPRSERDAAEDAAADDADDAGCDADAEDDGAYGVRHDRKGDAPHDDDAQG